jgi:hypothetical protein
MDSGGGLHGSLRRKLGNINLARDGHERHPPGVDLVEAALQ